MKKIISVVSLCIGMVIFVLQYKQSWDEFVMTCLFLYLLIIAHIYFIENFKLFEIKNFRLDKNVYVLISVILLVLIRFIIGIIS